MAASAEAAPVTWYASVDGGLSGIMDEEARFIGTVPAPIPFVTTTKVDVKFDSGWALFATLGMDIGGGWRMEGELGYRTNDFVIEIPPALGGYTKAGSLDELSFMGNYLLDLPLNKSGSLKATLGFGFGLDYAQMKTDFGLDGSEWSFAYQGIAGLSLAIDDKTDLTLDFRHLRVAEPKFEDHVTVDSQVRFDALGKSSLSIGLRHGF